MNAGDRDHKIKINGIIICVIKIMYQFFIMCNSLYKYKNKHKNGKIKANSTIKVKQKQAVRL